MELQIQFPEDFEELYKKYKASIEGRIQESPLDGEPLTPSPSNTDYSETEEPVVIRTLGIEIRGDEAKKGGNKFMLNPTDKLLVYYLYYKFTKNRDECFKLDRLASEINPKGEKKDEGYIKNRIAEINKGIKMLVTPGRTSIGSFIKLETSRGYHLNSQFFPVSQKNHKN